MPLSPNQYCSIFYYCCFVLQTLHSVIQPYHTFEPQCKKMGFFSILPWSGWSSLVILALPAELLATDGFWWVGGVFIFPYVLLVIPTKLQRAVLNLQFPWYPWWKSVDHNTTQNKTKKKLEHEKETGREWGRLMGGTEKRKDRDMRLTRKHFIYVWNCQITNLIIMMIIISNTNNNNTKTGLSCAKIFRGIFKREHPANR